MNGGDKISINFHLQSVRHHHQHLGSSKKPAMKDIPKGCLAIMVGRQGEEQQRFIVPVLYFNHPLFMGLLKEAEDEYGFDQKGTITIPCRVGDFRYVQGLIDKEISVDHHLRPIAGCFKA
ncbi:hypothetical protein Nepgr_019160 [Nepenthes gracilis]|uniref:Small auxin up regulated protein n=1 Tax=Nepenthes gracilis TaxID=150966 RepID=A0AAD3SUW8_NEPGR|nr:hypothetical protein Nepgr_019160 [Nepenthes gracilis]